MTFRLRNVPVLSRVGADRADGLRTDVDAAIAGWADALLMRVDHRNQVLVVDGRLVLGPAADFADAPPADAVFLGRMPEGHHVWAVRAALEAVTDEMRSSTAKPALLLPREPSLSMVDVALPSDDLLIDRYQHGVSAQGLFVASRHLLISGE